MKWSESSERRSAGCSEINPLIERLANQISLRVPVNRTKTVSRATSKAVLAKLISRYSALFLEKMITSSVSLRESGAREISDNVFSRVEWKSLEKFCVHAQFAEIFVNRRWICTDAFATR